jgi:hypothetical protein
MTEPLIGLRWDWPWLAPLSPYADKVSEALRHGQSVAQLLDRLAGQPTALGREALPVRFVPQDHLTEGQAYEDFIYQQRLVPTRDNLHDLFNGLTWLTFPRTKAKLNQLQAQAIAAAGVGATRGPLRDALTLFDENAALLLAPPELQQALQERQWQRLFIELRPLWAQAQVLLFGHAAQEKLQQPRKAITAHVYLPRRALSMNDLDAALADDLDADHLAQKPYSPLPVLGIPGWWPGNENFSFYDDPKVFRP